jgi:hypothetical protein
MKQDLLTDGSIYRRLLPASFLAELRQRNEVATASSGRGSASSAQRETPILSHAQ